LCAADVDGDGLPDLYFVTQLGASELWKNEGGGRFVNITAAAGLEMPDAVAAACAFADIDNDGLPDLFVTTVRHGNRLFHNVGGRFKDGTRAVGLVDSSWSGDATVLDVNDDGRPDLYILNMQGENHLWLNEGGKRFRDATREYFPRTPWGAMGVKAFDFDGDGRVDLLVTDMHDDMWANIPPGDWA